jgi:hypothetical protein
MLPLQKAEIQTKFEITSMLKFIERATAEHIIRSQRKFKALKRIKDSIIGE